MEKIVDLHRSPKLPWVISSFFGTFGSIGTFLTTIMNTVTLPG